jgi:predicted chitinase
MNWNDYPAIAAAIGCAKHEADVAANWPLIKTCLDSLGLSSDACYIAALATVAVETAWTFRPIHELGNRKYFERYDHRADLGNTHAGDGYTYRGAGFVQITGEDNFKRYGDLLGIDMIDDPADPTDNDNPNKAVDPNVAASILAVYFRDHHIAEAAEANNWSKVRKAVNGGYNGLEDFLRCVTNLQKLAAQEI